MTVEYPAADQAVFAHLYAKERVTREVIAGRRSLLEAAADLKAIDDQGPPCPGWVVLGPPPGVSVEEYYCRMTINWVRSEGPSDEVEDRTCVLEAELYDRLHDGTLRLPEP